LRTMRGNQRRDGEDGVTIDHWAHELVPVKHSRVSHRTASPSPSSSSQCHGCCFIEFYLCWHPANPLFYNDSYQTIYNLKPFSTFKSTSSNLTARYMPSEHSFPSCVQTCPCIPNWFLSADALKSCCHARPR